MKRLFQDQIIRRLITRLDGRNGSFNGFNFGAAITKYFPIPGAKAFSSIPKMSGEFVERYTRNREGPAILDSRMARVIKKPHGFKTE
ncbi:hypothetical protein CDL12_14583 [Handroanthus impetiginosus]|uniref:Uncharacterized protein n=1 Tax=Handroanthus impetiginosus TaxID=429701 RepID=A0A2G9H5L4_9LAMI|nr:hypothetical protein CDL12_14583 [Handroanthus impetiginosus]